MHVRAATETDAEAIAGILALVAEEGMLGAEPPVDVAERACAVRERIADPGAAGRTLVLEKDQELVGYLLARESAAGVLSFGMALLPGARGSGGGRRLIEALADHALRVGAHKLELQAWTENAPAIAFYAKLGFELEGIRREHYRRRDGTLRSTVVMARRIGSAGEER